MPKPDSNPDVDDLALVRAARSSLLAQEKALARIETKLYRKIGGDTDAEIDEKAGKVKPTTADIAALLQKYADA